MHGEARQPDVELCRQACGMHFQVQQAGCCVCTGPCSLPTCGVLCGIRSLPCLDRSDLGGDGGSIHCGRMPCRRGTGG